MTSSSDLDRLLVTLDVSVQQFATCEVRRGRRLLGPPVDAVTVHYVLAGTFHMEITGRDPVVCGPGGVVLVPPRVQWSVTADNGPVTEEVAEEDALRARDGLLIVDAADGEPGDLRFACGLIGASLSGSIGLLDRLRVPIVEDMSDSEVVRHAYRIMLDEIAGPGLASRALTSALMKMCLLMVIRRFFGRPGFDQTLIGALADPRLASTVASILDEPAAPHSVASLASGAAMSRSTFVRQFSAAFDMSPMEFVAKTRLHHAADMLRSTKLPIKTIAASIGFCSRSHFSRAFRDAYGTDPSAFRDTTVASALDAPGPLPGSHGQFEVGKEPG